MQPPASWYFAQTACDASQAFFMSAWCESGHAYAALLSCGVAHTVLRTDHESVFHWLTLYCALWRLITHSSLHHDPSHCLSLTLLLSHIFLIPPRQSIYLLGLLKAQCTFLLLHLSHGRSTALALILTLSCYLTWHAYSASVSLSLACCLYNCISNSASSRTSCLTLPLQGLFHAVVLAFLIVALLLRQHWKFHTNVPSACHTRRARIVILTLLDPCSSQEKWCIMKIYRLISFHKT